MNNAQFDMLGMFHTYIDDDIAQIWMFMCGLINGWIITHTSSMTLVHYMVIVYGVARSFKPSKLTSKLIMRGV